MRVDGTLDLECASWSRFAVAATYQAARGTSIHRSIGSLTDHLLDHGGNWWAHAGGVYDLLAIAEELRARGLAATIDMSGTRVSRVRVGKLTLRDSWSLVPLPLEVAASIAGVVAPKFPFPCECHARCAGFCAIRPDDPRPELADYCAADARTLYLVLQAIDEFADRIGVTLKGTLGASAWATARERLDLPDCDLEAPTWRAIHRAYYGGRVTIVRPHASGPGSHWDVSSAYPAALAACELPTGQWRMVGSSDARACLARDRPGIYECTIEIPRDAFMPPLPIRLPDERIVYPVGRIHGSWAQNEIARAEDSGARVISVESAIVWERTQAIFGPLVRKWYRIRRAVGKRSALGQWMRLLANTLPGKFAERPERRSVTMHPDKIKICDARKPCTLERCIGACGAYEQLDLEGRMWSVPFFRAATSGHIHWASYLTAHARGVWLDGAERVGTDLVYGDTDSIWTLGREAPGRTGSALGQWEYQHAWDHWECVAPKTYRYRDPSSGVVVRTAGMSITDEEWRRGEAKIDRGVQGLVEAARSSDATHGLFRRASRHFRLSTRATKTGRYGDRILDRRDGITYPVPNGEKI